MIDIFQYSNVYAATTSVARLYTDRELQIASVLAVVASPSDANCMRISRNFGFQICVVMFHITNNDDTQHTLAPYEDVTWSEVLALYCAMQPPRTVRMLCAANASIGTRISEKFVKHAPRVVSVFSSE